MSEEEDLDVAQLLKDTRAKVAALEGKTPTKEDINALRADIAAMGEKIKEFAKPAEPTKKGDELDDLFG